VKGRKDVLDDAWEKEGKEKKKKKFSCFPGLHGGKKRRAPIVLKKEGG